MIVLIHSSKTMKHPSSDGVLRQPELLIKTSQLASYLKTLSIKQLTQNMHLSVSLAKKTKLITDAWTDDPSLTSLAIDSFVGDIYSGLRAGELDKNERDYADEHLRIISGMYGILRPYDGISPYRLEMGYKLPNNHYSNLYSFWGQDIADTLPRDALIVNASALEYTKAVLPYINSRDVYTPKFLTKNSATGVYTNIIVHSKVARGAFARWIILNKVERFEDLRTFDDLGYKYNVKLSSLEEPVFSCEQYGGLGLSVRL